MRVTSKQMADNFTANLFRQSEQLLDAQERLASQRRINRPSDDPVGMGKVLDYRTSLSRIEQYRRNIDRAQSHVETSETVLNTVDELLVQAKEIASEHASGFGEGETWNLAAEQVAAIREQLFDLANSKNGDHYLFSGRDSLDPAFGLDGATGAIGYEGDATAGSEARYIIGDGVTVGVEANGQTVFTGGGDAFSLLQDLSDALVQDPADTATIGSVQAQMQDCIDQVRAVRAGNGAVAERLKATGGQLDRLELNLDNLRGREEDLDVAQAAVELQLQETSYQVALATAARIIQPSLVDFLG